MKISAIYRYPVKGLSPEALEAIDLQAGETIPCDRIYAIENGLGRFDPEAPRHLPKIVFLMLMRNERLATLDATFEEDTQTLTLRREGKQVARGALNTSIGRVMIEQFLAAYMKDDLRGPPKIVFADSHSFSDVAAKCLHIVNLASVRELERAAGRPINPLRFRPNVVIEGAEPWEEFSWLDRTIRMGCASLEVFDRTVRCAATEVDPATATRDIALPALIERTYGHSDFGIYARVTAPGRIARGDAVAALTDG